MWVLGFFSKCRDFIVKGGFFDFVGFGLFLRGYKVGTVVVRISVSLVVVV